MIKISSMKGTLALASVLASVAFHSASGQNAMPDGDRSKNLLIRPYLAPTGQVVPKPGASQSGPPTAPDIKAQQQDNKIMKSICSNC
jgi:hypothetical protein